MSKPKASPRAEKLTDEMLQQRFGEEDFKGENKLKMKIIDIETENEVHRSKLFELNETVTTILHKAKIRSGPIPVLENQLGVVAQELANVLKLIEIYKRNLAMLSKKNPASEQVQIIAQSNLQLRIRQGELQSLKREVKLIQTNNKGLEYKLNQYSKRGRNKSVDEHGLRMKEAVAENKALRKRLEEIESSEKRREESAKVNYESTRDLEKKVTGLPLLKSSRLANREQRSKTSQSKLETEKKIYQKWFKAFIPVNLEKTEKEIEDFVKIKTLLLKRIHQSQEEQQTLKGSLSFVKEKVNPAELQKARESLKKEEKVKKVLKNAECACDIRHRTLRKDWVGRFDGLRFSDSRSIRQETRLFKVMHNNIGYYQFSYYSVKNPKKRYTCDLPFPLSSALKGKQSIFEVEYPDFIKTFVLRMNRVSSKIVGMEMISNLGMSYEFLNALESKEEKGSNEISSRLTVRPNEAPTLMFGCYSTLYDQKKNLIGVHLEGLGIQIIEDQVEEMI